MYCFFFSLIHPVWTSESLGLVSVLILLSRNNVLVSFGLDFTTALHTVVDHFYWQSTTTACKGKVLTSWDFCILFFSYILFSEVAIRRSALWSILMTWLFLYSIQDCLLLCTVINTFTLKQQRVGFFFHKIFCISTTWTKCRRSDFIISHQILR